MGRDAVPPNSLPGEINTATRSLHTTLNRLITARLPLGLPPHTTDSTLYTTGLLHFAHIFLTFESLWADLLPTSPGAASPPISPLLSYLLVNPYAEPSLFTSSNPPSPELLAFLQTLRPTGLARSSRLKKDMEHLMEVHPTDLDVVLAQYPGEKVADFCAHIRRSVQARPHVLVAYAWCFYMAVFSGGRWIRSELLKAGPEFWGASHVEQDEKMTGTEPRGLAFWHFLGSNDGEDIKSLFKARLEAAETLFTAAERIDIIEEAKTIFELSATLVTELDEKLGTDMEKSKKLEQAERQRERKGTGVQESRGTLEVLQQQATHTKLSDAVMWLRKPEVTGTMLALGCLACAALLRLQD